MLLSFNSYHVISKPVVFCMYLVQRTLKTGWRQNSSLYSECLMCCYTDLLTALRIQFHVIGRSGFCVFSLLRRCDTVFVALTGYIFWYQRIVVNSYQRNNLRTYFWNLRLKVPLNILHILLSVICIFLFAGEIWCCSSFKIPLPKGLVC